LGEESPKPASTPAGVVFLSYASQDADAAQRICNALRTAGIEVWFDQSELRGGEAWNRHIQRQIHQCALFIAVISQHTEQRSEGYFRREWRLAVERTRDMADDQAFLLPIVIDGTREDRARVPDRFREFQWLRLPAGDMPPDAVQRIKRLLLSAGPIESTTPGEIARSQVDALDAASPGVAARGQRLRQMWPALVVTLVVLISGGYLLRESLQLAKHSPPASPSEELSIAVLPFIDLSEKHDQEYFADGVAEEILDLLAKVPKLRVIARTSSFSFKNKADDIPTIAGKLRVADILQGSVRTSGDRIRISTQLIRADSGAQVWSEAYDRTVTDVFEVQDDIARNVLRSLQAALLPRVHNRSSSTANPQAYSLYLQGKYLRSRLDVAGTRQAIESLGQATGLDSGYAAAWTELAFSYFQLGYFFESGSSVADSMERARVAVQRALALDPTMALAHVVLANIKMDYDFDFAGASAEYAAAERADPEFSYGNWVTLYKGCLAGRCLDDFIATQSRRVDRDPVNPECYTDRGTVYLLSGRFDDAERDFQHALELSPSNVFAHLGLASVWIDREKPEKALQEAELITAEASKLTVRVIALDQLSRQAEADEALRVLMTRFAYGWAYRVAEVYGKRGNTREAVNWLERAYRQRDGGLALAKIDPWFTPIRGSAAYQEFLRKIKLSD
jgi:TolB-like protein